MQGQCPPLGIILERSHRASQLGSGFCLSVGGHGGPQNKMPQIVHTIALFLETGLLSIKSQNGGHHTYKFVKNFNQSLVTYSRVAGVRSHSGTLSPDSGAETVQHNRNKME